MLLLSTLLRPLPDCGSSLRTLAGIKLLSILDSQLSRFSIPHLLRFRHMFENLSFCPEIFKHTSFCARRSFVSGISPVCQLLNIKIPEPGINIALRYFDIFEIKCYEFAPAQRAGFMGFFFI